MLKTPIQQLKASECFLIESLHVYDSCKILRKAPKVQSKNDDLLTKNRIEKDRLQEG